MDKRIQRPRQQENASLHEPAPLNNIMATTQGRAESQIVTFSCDYDDLLINQLDLLENRQQGRFIPHAVGFDSNGLKIIYDTGGMASVTDVFSREAPPQDITFSALIRGIIENALWCIENQLDPVFLITDPDKIFLSDSLDTIIMICLPLISKIPHTCETFISDNLIELLSESSEGNTEQLKILNLYDIDACMKILLRIESMEYNNSDKVSDTPPVLAGNSKSTESSGRSRNDRLSKTQESTQEPINRSQKTKGYNPEDKLGLKLSKIEKLKEKILEKKVKLIYTFFVLAQIILLSSGIYLLRNIEIFPSPTLVKTLVLGLLLLLVTTDIYLIFAKFSPIRKIVTEKLTNIKEQLGQESKKFLKHENFSGKKLMKPLGEPTELIDIDKKNSKIGMLSSGLPGTFEEADGHKGFILTDDFLIGRDVSRVDFKIPGSSVGRLHARITRRHNSFFIEDLGSANGTYVDGRRIRKGMDYPLTEKCTITFADKLYYFIVS